MGARRFAVAVLPLPGAAASAGDGHLSRRAQHRIFSCDLDSFDFKASKAQTIVDSVMKKVDKLGKGIILMHDFQKHTAEALPVLLRKLKAGVTRSCR